MDEWILLAYLLRAGNPLQDKDTPLLLIVNGSIPLHFTQDKNT